MRKWFGLCILWLMAWTVARGQDPQFTQFYAAPIYHNPAFTGSAYAPRIILNYRNQWPSLHANFITTTFSVDHYIDKYNSGIGLLLMKDEQGYNLSTTEVRLSYAYEVKLTPNDGLRLGLNGGYSQRGLNSTGWVFGDQLSEKGPTGNPSGDPLAGVDLVPSNTLDVGAGLLYFNPKYYIGASANHLTEPNLQLLSGPNGSKLPRIFMVHGGYNIDLNHLISRGDTEREFTLTPTFLYKKQGQFSQLDLGGYLTYSPFTIGAQYRGIPLSKVFNSFPNQDALAFLVGFRHDRLSFGYSYDLTISGLGAQSGGSHEISLAYQLENPALQKANKIKTKKKALKCPKF